MANCQAIMEGESWIPPIKSRQPGSVKGLDPKNVTTSDIETSDHGGEIGKAKHIGFNLGSQLQKKDTGLHLQP